MAYAPFTPSRFLTDLSPLLALFCGVALAWVQRQWNLSPARMLLLGTLGALTLLPSWRKITDVAPLPAAVVRAYEWIDRFAPADAIVANTDPWHDICRAGASRSFSCPSPSRISRRSIPTQNRRTCSPFDSQASRMRGWSYGARPRVFGSCGCNVPSRLTDALVIKGKQPIEMFTWHGHPARACRYSGTSRSEKTIALATSLE